MSAGDRAYLSLGQPIFQRSMHAGGPRGTVSALSLAQMPTIAASPVQPLNAEEQEQLQQTIEMFDVITQANPQDTQSMEILKEAYFKLGQTKDGLNVSRRLADTFMELNQFSGALLEYEFILQHEPGNADVVAALGLVEERLKASQAEAQRTSGGNNDVGAISLHDAYFLHGQASRDVIYPYSTFLFPLRSVLRVV